MLFQWTRLGINQFRLLERRTPLPNGTPSFVLKTFTLTSPSTPPYAAILYQQQRQDAPPSPSPAESVILNGRSFAVSSDAFEALKKVEAGDGEGSEFLWIDCLCVNLKDEWERSVRDEVMGRIFEGAETVVAWMRDDLPEVLTGSSTREDLESEALRSPKVAAFRRAFEELDALPESESLWSSAGIRTKSKVVLMAGRARIEDDAVRRIFTSNEQQSSKSASL